MIVSASVGSAFIGSCVLAGAGILQYKPAQQHVAIEISKSSWAR